MSLPDSVLEERALNCIDINWDKEHCKSCENYEWCLDQVETSEAFRIPEKGREQ